MYYSWVRDYFQALTNSPVVRTTPVVLVEKLTILLVFDQNHYSAALPMTASVSDPPPEVVS